MNNFTEPNGFEQPTYNPRLLHDPLQQQHPVIYPEILDAITTELIHNRGKKTPRHQLLVGLSGMGKSTLLLQLADYINSSQQLSNRWIPLVFPEQQLNINSLNSFWLNCIDAFAAVLKNTEDNKEALDIVIQSSQKNKNNADDTLKLLNNIAKNNGKKLIFLVDNLNVILQQLNTEHQLLYDVLAKPSQFILIASYTRATDGKHLDYASAQKLFEIHALNGLNESGLALQLNSRVDSPGTVAYGHDDRNNNIECRRLFSLTAGNPRTTRLIFDVVQNRTKSTLYPALHKLLDRITPWYRIRLMELPPTSRSIFNLLATHWEPLSELQIVEISHLTKTEVTTQLNFLTQHGILNKSTDKTPVSYQIRERFFNIWYLAHTQSQLQTPGVWLNYFILTLFSDQERQEIARQLLLMPPTYSSQPEYIIALSQTVKPAALRRALKHHLLTALIDDASSHPAIQKLFYIGQENEELNFKIKYLQDTKKCHELITDTLDVRNIVAESFCNILFGSPSLSPNEKLNIAAETENFSEFNWHSLNRQLTDEARQWQNILGHHAKILYKAIGCGEMMGLNDIDGAESASEHWENPIIAAISWDAWLQSNNTINQQQIERVLELYYQALDFDSRLPILWNNLGDFLQFRMEQTDDAESAYRKAINIKPNLASSWTHLARFLKHQPNRLSEAEKAYRIAIENAVDKHDSYNNLAWFLYKYTNRLEEAINWAKKATALRPHDSYSSHTLATLEVKSKNWDAASITIQGILASDSSQCGQNPNDETLDLFREIIRADKADEVIVMFEETKADQRWNSLYEALKATRPSNSNGLEYLDSTKRDSIQGILQTLTA